MRVAVLASGSGSNFQVIAEAFQAGTIPGELALVFSDKKDAYVLERAAALGVPSKSFGPKDFGSKAAYEAALLEILTNEKIDFLILAGYMRIIGEGLLAAYPKKIVNIHPSLLPSFPGLQGIKDAFDYGVKITGVTVHYIDSGVDTGPIIAQGTVAIDPEDTLETLETKIHQVEHQLYPQVLAQILA